MLTEQKLFRGDTELSLLEKVRAARVVAPSTINPEVPKSLDAIVLKSLALEPEDRYSNASDLLRDLEAVLYSYTPAPGSADLAIYLHRLQSEETSARESRDREAAGSAAPSPEKKKKPKIAPARRVTDAAPKIPAHAAPPPAPPALSEAPLAEPGPPGVFGAFSEKRLEQKSRTPLYAMIGGAVVILAVGAYWVSHRSPAPGGSTVRATPLPVAAVPTAAPAPPVVVSPISRADAKAEEEAQRLARKKELQKSLEALKARDAAVPTPLSKKTTEAPAAVAAPAVTAAPIREPTPEPARPEPTVREAAPEPTAAPPPPVRSAPAVSEAREEVNRGDLVGPGAGVVEPALISTPRVVYPALARQQRLSGRVIVLVLVDEDGAVSEARLQQGLPSKTGVNEAVVEAVRASKFRPATKNGTAVKMWRTVVVEVKP
jgi:eukaryotic-like serine/threonine-protein kinase